MPPRQVTVVKAVGLTVTQPPRNALAGALFGDATPDITVTLSSSELYPVRGTAG